MEKPGARQAMSLRLAVCDGEPTGIGHGPGPGIGPGIGAEEGHQRFSFCVSGPSAKRVGCARRKAHAATHVLLLATFLCIFSTVATGASFAYVNCYCDNFVLNGAQPATVTRVANMGGAGMLPAACISAADAAGATIIGMENCQAGGCECWYRTDKNLAFATQFGYCSGATRGCTSGTWGGASSYVGGAAWSVALYVAIAPLPASYYPTSSYVNGFTLRKSNLIDVIALPAQYTVSFDLYPTAVGTVIRDIVHLSAKNGNWDSGAGSLLPRVSFYGTSESSPGLGLSISYIGSGTANSNERQAAVSQNLPLSQWSIVTVTVDAVNLFMTLSVTGAITIPTATATFPVPLQQTWPSVGLYASSPWEETAAAEIRNLVVAPPAILPVRYYPSSSYASGFILTSGNLIGVIALPAQYTVSFDLMPTADGSGYRSIVHLTATGGNMNGAGSRLPGIWLNLDAPTLGLLVCFIGSATIDQKLVVPTQAQPLNQWSTVLITIDAVNLMMSLTVSGGVTIPTMSIAFPTPSQQTWPSVQVYASNPWDAAAAAKIRNLAVLYFAPTSVPTLRPSAAPSKIPSASPSVLPSAYPTLAPSALPSPLPSAKPSAVPTCMPTLQPSAGLTIAPTLTPSSERWQRSSRPCSRDSWAGTRETTLHRLTMAAWPSWNGCSRRRGRRASPSSSGRAWVCRPRSLALSRPPPPPPPPPPPQPTPPPV